VSQVFPCPLVRLIQSPATCPNPLCRLGDTAGMDAQSSWRLSLGRVQEGRQGAQGPGGSCKQGLAALLGRRWVKARGNFGGQLLA
jgi:hypothetical protein